MHKRLGAVIGIALSLIFLSNSAVMAEDSTAEELPEEISDINALIGAAVERAITSETRVFTDTVSQEQYGDMRLTWQYSGTEFSDLLTDIDAQDFHAHYGYDGDFRRISKNVDGITTYYVWSGDGALVSEVNDNYTVNYRYAQGFLIGFEYDSEVYEYIFDEDFTITRLRHNDSVICEYEYRDGALCAVYQLDKNGGRFLNTDPLYAGNVNGYKYKSNYVDSETGWIYSGRYADWEKGRYVDGLACADMQRYIEEAGDITPEIMYRINDIGFGGRKSGISDGNVSVAAYSSAASVVPYVEQLDKVSKTIWFESPKDALDQTGVAQVIQNRMARDSRSAFEVISNADDFAAYQRVLTGQFPDTTSPVWSQALENARRLINKTSLVYQSSWFDNVYNFKGLNKSVVDAYPKFKYMNGTKWYARVGTKNGDVYVPVKDIYTVVNENGASYVGGYITSIETLASLDVRYGKMYKYNVFYKFV